MKREKKSWWIRYDIKKYLYIRYSSYKYWVISIFVNLVWPVLIVIRIAYLLAIFCWNYLSYMTLSYIYFQIEVINRCWKVIWDVLLEISPKLRQIGSLGAEFWYTTTYHMTTRKTRNLCKTTRYWYYL